MNGPPKMSTPGFYAFPYAISVSDGNGGTYYQYCAGMTMRDYLAAAALSRIPPGVTDKNAAQQAYSMADAMLAAREGK